MNKLCFLALISLLISSCSSNWEAEGSVFLKDGITPIGIEFIEEQMWLSDGDNNRLVVVDMKGNIIEEVADVERPMHMEVSDGRLLVPSYGSDDILSLQGKTIDTVEVTVPLDAPAAVSSNKEVMAIADFYNNEIAIRTNGTWSKVGEKGRGDLQFNYPTDVQIFEDKIFVADAYNHRIQVLSLTGEHLLTFGADQKMNAATGLFVTQENIFVTDFENDRVLIFDHSGKVVQIIDVGLNKPTDLIVKDGRLYVTNYAGKYLTYYKN